MVAITAEWSLGRNESCYLLVIPGFIEMWVIIVRLVCCFGSDLGLVHENCLIWLLGRTASSPGTHWTWLVPRLGLAVFLVPLEVLKYLSGVRSSDCPTVSGGVVLWGRAPSSLPLNSEVIPELMGKENVSLALFPASFQLRQFWERPGHILHLSGSYHLKMRVFFPSAFGCAVSLFQNPTAHIHLFGSGLWFSICSHNRWMSWPEPSEWSSSSHT